MRQGLTFLATLLAAAPQEALAQSSGNDQGVLAMRAADAVAVMQRLRPVNEVFNQTFLNEVSPERLAGLIGQLEGQSGKLLRAESVTQTGPGAASMALVFERARAPATMLIEPFAPRRISRYRITAVTSQASSDQAGLAGQFAALPGVAGYSVSRLDAGGPVSIQSSRADQPMAIGSAFKL